VRDPLRPFENQLLLFTGRLASVRSHGDQRDHLIRALKCWQWDGNAAIDLERPCDLRIDHAWVRVSADHSPSMELLRPCTGVARVSWYRRSDGSVDLGLCSRPLLCLDELLLDLREAARVSAPRPELIKALDRVLPRLALPDHYAFSAAVTTDQAITALKGFHSRLLRSQEKEEQIAATSHRGHKPTSARRFADLLKQHTA
jgi:hypothetical protein